jgi:hypothetical protein
MHQLLPDERRGFDVLAAATQGANPAAQVPRQRTQAAARQFGKKPTCDFVSAHDVERKLAAGQASEERLLESGEVDDRWCRLWRERRSIVSELAPDEVGVGAVPDHWLRDTCDSRDGWWDSLAAWKRDEVRACLRDRRPRQSPRDLKEVPARSRRCGLAVNH